MFDYLLDKHVDQTYKAFHQIPLNRNLRVVWFGICVWLVYLWQTTHFNPEIRAKQCIAELQPDGKWTMTNEGNAGENAVNVSNNFSRLSYLCFVQALIQLMCCLYQLTAIFLFKQMFRYRMIVSRFNKINLLFGAFLLGLTYWYRISGAGKFCAGSHLTNEELNDPEISKTYLIEEGKVFIGLINSSWIFVTSAILGAIGLGSAAYLAFK